MHNISQIFITSLTMVWPYMKYFLFGNTKNHMHVVKACIYRNPWFVDNKFSIHFGEDKTKCILFTSKNRIKKVGNLSINHGDIQIKQHSKVTYLGCVLDEDLSGESMATKVMGKINGRIKFLYRKNRFLDSSLRRLLCNALVQPHLCLFSMVPKFNTAFKKETADHPK